MATTAKNTAAEPLYRANHDRDRDGPLSDAVVEALAAVENVDPDELDLRLYDSVDGDALDRLYEVTAERSERLRVTFSIGDYEVTVRDDGLLEVRARSDGPVGDGR
ncbi:MULTISPECIES: HalOD1 output domain-containing protein [Halorussus]|uniref:HalOD1 output domain-containing protein n=1 Tax=Halorussus TaxID=1070314 RepID=UPI000E21AAEE|nr:MULTISPECIES: HalOD1 output domain-containing protein [Halorussus]NHN60629.1 hypothetical protein [Halorussus sp. JP-T4]